MQQTPNRRQFLAGAATVASGLAQTPATGKASEHPAHHDRPTAMGDHRGTLGMPDPNLDRLAKSGMLFERSYTPSAVCCPARAMLLSGAYHWHNGVYNQVHSAPSVHRDMFPDVVLYSQRLREAGYTLGYVGKVACIVDSRPVGLRISGGCRLGILP